MPPRKNREKPNPLALDLITPTQEEIRREFKEERLRSGRSFYAIRNLPPVHSRTTVAKRIPLTSDRESTASKTLTKEQKKDHAREQIIRDSRRSQGNTTNKFKDLNKGPDRTAFQKLAAPLEDYVTTYYHFNGILRPEYDMLEPFTIVDTESYLKQAINRRLALVAKAGFEVVGSDPKYSDIINDRLLDMEYVSGKSTETLLTELLYSLFLCSNAFLVKIRSSKASGITKRDGMPQPVAGYLPVPAHSILPYMVDGQIGWWRRFYDIGFAPYEDFDVEDVIHFTFDRKYGHIYGTPRTVGVKDDIFSLRRLEENVELLLINHLFPLMHIKIGSKEQPADYFPNGISEVDYYRDQLQDMPKEGVLVTDERVVVDVTGIRSQAPNVDSTISHFKSRVFTGLSVGPADMGEAGASRMSADVISLVLKESVESDLKRFGFQLKNYMFRELLEESSPAVSIMKALASLSIQFGDIDSDSKIKDQNHSTQLFNNNGITHDEYRKSLGKEPFAEDDWTQSHRDLNVIHVDRELFKTQNAINQVQGTLSNAKSKAKGLSKPNKAVQNIETPTNQHGSNLGPTKAKSALEEIKTILQDNPMTWKNDCLEYIDVMSTPIDDNDLYTIEMSGIFLRLKSLIEGSQDINLLLDLLNTEDLFE